MLDEPTEERYRTPSHLSLALRLAFLSSGVALSVTFAGWLFSVGVAVLIATLAILLRMRTSARWLFLGALSIVLVGYLLFGRGFAYLGVPPIYPGEIVLVLGLFAAAVGRPALGALKHPISILVVFFMIWGAARTIPYVSIFGLDAIRDSAVWVYGAFALLIPLHARGRPLVVGVVKAYGTVLPVVLVWFAAYGLFAQTFRSWLPVEAAPGVPLLGLKGGDMGVHLAGIAAYLLLGLGKRRSRVYMTGLHTWSGVLLFALWLTGLVAVALSNRGGLMAILAALAVVMVLRPTGSRWGRAAIAALLLVSASYFAQPPTDEPTIAQQVLTRANSVWLIATGREEQAFRAGTALWRTDWWTKIIDYTLMGDYFILGKGYGINLADDDGFQVLENGSLRSPHNGHLTILARSGVPGAILWISLQTVALAYLLRAGRNLRRLGKAMDADIVVWTLAYLVASLTNATFDVYLEGPQGGIWHWSIVGFAVTALLALGSLGKPRGP